MSFLEDIFSIKNRDGVKLLTLMGMKIHINYANLKSGIPANIKPVLEMEKKSQEKILNRIRKNGKCRVAFLVYEIAKWKTDTLFQLMQQDERFEPFIVIGMTTGRIHTLSYKEKCKKIEEIEKFFKDKGYQTYIGADIKKQVHISLEKFEPDVIFYQQHLGNSRINYVKKTNKYALTCYVPYNVPNYCNIAHDYDVFCLQLFRFYTLSEWLKQSYLTINKDINNIKVTGHTALDLFYLNKDKQNENKYVIYAPHFSVMHPNVENKFYYSTFAENAIFMLDYAMKHPEIDWVFKPHPNLKATMKKMGIPEKNIENYYNKWRKIGTVCESSDYYELFANSKAMITDCGSFLTEYFCTGKPLLHLIPKTSLNLPDEAMEPMFNSFYKIYGNQMLEDTIERVVINGDDYKLQERKDAMEKLQFANCYAAQNIMDDLSSAFFE